MPLPNSEPSSLSAAEQAPASRDAGLRKFLEQADQTLSDLGDLDADAVATLSTIPSDELTDVERALLDELAAVTEPTAASSAIIDSVRKDSAINLRTENNNWTLLLDLVPPVAGGKFCTAKMILQGIAKAGIKQGVQTKAIRTAAAKHREGERIRGLPVVIGKPPTEPQAGYIEIACRSHIAAEQKTFKGLDKAPKDASKRICIAEDIVARLIPPVPGKPGCNALGKIIPASKPFNSNLVPGRNTRLNGDRLIAEVDGMIEFSNGGIHIKQLLLVSEDVIGQAARIEFDGDVHINAEVREGATVKATGSITVEKNVVGASLYSKSESIYLRQGVTGDSHTEVCAAKDIHTRYAENATLRAGGIITLEVGSLHSYLIAGERIDAHKGRGHVVGGVVIAGKQITAKQFGNKNGIKTVVITGLSGEQIDRRANLETEYAACSDQFEQAQSAADRIKSMVGDITKLPVKDRDIYTRLLKVMLLSKNRMRTIVAQRDDPGDSNTKPGRGEVTALNCFLPGTTLTLGTTTKDFTEPHQAGTAKLHKDSIVLKRVK